MAQQRLGSLTSIGGDRWWYVEPCESLAEIADLLLRDIEAFALPWLRQQIDSSEPELSDLLSRLGSMDGGLGRFGVAVAELITADRLLLSPAEWVEFARGFEVLRNQLAVVDHEVVAGLDVPETVDRWAARDVAGVFVTALGVSRAEARRRVLEADALGVRVGMTGESLPVRFPVLAAVQAAGLLGREHRVIAVECLHTLARRYGAGVEVLDRAEQTLASWAPDLGVDGYRKVAAHVIEVEFPDGLIPDDEQIEQAREVRLRTRRDGSWALSGTLTGECGSQLAAVLDAYAKPAPAEDAPDRRTHSQRQHDGLQTACAALLRSGTLPDCGGTPASVVITIPLAQLSTGSGETADGHRLSAESVGRLLHEAEILPTVIAPSGAVIWQGHDRRLATPAQTRWLIARDGGCSFPGCDRPPAHCQRHHVTDWASGGPTVVDNLTLLCGHHHRTFAKAGWACTMIDGLPWWTPPPWIDPGRRPRLHHRITLRAQPPPLPMRT